MDTYIVPVFAKFDTRSWCMNRVLWYVGVICVCSAAIIAYCAYDDHIWTTYHMHVEYSRRSMSFDSHAFVFVHARSMHVFIKIRLLRTLYNVRFISKLVKLMVIILVCALYSTVALKGHNQS